MSILTSARDSADATAPLAKLINNGCKAVGGIYRMDYNSALVLTDDHRKFTAGGVPLGAYLLAAACRRTPAGFALEDEELVLLRVRGTAPLPNDAELAETRLAVVRDSLALETTYDEQLDVFTRDELQQSAFDCEVLGTFYRPADGNNIDFGADVDNVVASAKYIVFLPGVDVLSWLASFPEPDAKGTLPLGMVRFSSTRRRAQESGLASAAVNVHVQDFIGRKTAVFGMTRTGKSNTIKTLVTSIDRFASESRLSIGQLIFDPQGEYANANQQDGTALRLLGDDDKRVVIYKMDPDSRDGREKPLRINFLNVDATESVWGLLLGDILNSASGSTQYLAGLRSIEFSAPAEGDYSSQAKYERYLLGLFAILHRGGVQGDVRTGERLGFQVTMAGAARESVCREITGLTEVAGKKLLLKNTDQAAKVFEWVNANLKTKFDQNDRKVEALKSWSEHTEFLDMAKALSGGGGAVASVKRIRAFHDAAARANVAEQVWQDMKAGRLAIVDLSKGNQQIAKTMSERIVTHLVNEANSLFIKGDELVPFQIVVEEAHNLFERGAKDVEGNPWVRLSKEAAKYKIGLVYATQEVTSVDQRILSNTSNWLVAHLNSDNETRELSHYYDFKTWADSLRRCEDVGFVRMKTYSGKYIVPLQVAVFDHDMINGARRAAGLSDYDFQAGLA